jgi:flagellar hook assembly protein FlgD
MPTSITTPAPTAIPTVQASASITSGSVINTADGDSVEIGYSLKSPSRVRIIIYDRNGKPVNTLVSATMSAGTYNASWSGVFEDGKTVGAGIYIIYVKIGTLEKKLKVAVEK